MFGQRFYNDDINVTIFCVSSGSHWKEEYQSIPPHSYFQLGFLLTSHLSTRELHIYVWVVFLPCCSPLILGVQIRIPWMDGYSQNGGGGLGVWFCALREGKHLESGIFAALGLNSVTLLQIVSLPV